MAYKNGNYSAFYVKESLIDPIDCLIASVDAYLILVI